MNTLQMPFQSLLEDISKNIPYQASLVVAFSGGRDSVCLLHLLCSLRKRRHIAQLRALHLQHTEDPLERFWADFCVQFAQQNQVVCRVLKTKFPNQDKGLEASEREMRYSSFQAHVTKEEFLVTAHHQMDQAETILLQLKTGSGPTGLSGMRLRSQWGASLNILRPLLDIPSETLESYFQANQLQCVEDPSNQTVKADRNFFRKVILPTCEKRFPGFIKNLSHSASLCQQYSEGMESYLNNLLSSMLQPDDGLSVSYLKQQDEKLRWMILRTWLKQHKAWPVRRWHLNAIWQQCIQPQKASFLAAIQIHRSAVRRHRDALYITEETDASFINETRFDPNIELLFHLPKGSGKIRCVPVKQSAPVEVFPPFRLAEPFAYPRKKLKAFFQKYQIPVWLRKKIPYLRDLKDQLLEPFQFFTLLEPEKRSFFIQWEVPGIRFQNPDSFDGN